MAVKITEQDNGQAIKAPKPPTSRPSVEAIMRRLAKKHRRSLEILEAYDKGEVDRPHVRQAD